MDKSFETQLLEITLSFENLAKKEEKENETPSIVEFKFATTNALARKQWKRLLFDECVPRE